MSDSGSGHLLWGRVIKVEIENPGTAPLHIAFVVVQIDHGGRVGVARRRVELARRNGMLIVAEPKPTRATQTGAYDSVEVQNLVGRRRRENGELVLEGEAGSGYGGRGEVEVKRGGIGGDIAVAAGGLDGATLARAGVLDVTIGWRREIGFGLGAAKLPSGGVVGTRRLLRRVEGAQPNAALLAGISDLGGVSPPWPLPDSPKMHLLDPGGCGGVSVSVNLNGSGLVPGRHNIVID